MQLKRVLLAAAAIVLGAVEALAQYPADTLTVAMVGDIMPGNTYPEPHLPRDDGKHLFEHCDSLLRSADLAIGNLEGVLCVGGTSTNIGKPHGYTFRIPPHYIELFKDAGFDYLHIANNHMRDFGPYGYEMCMDILDKAGMPYSGIKGYRDHAIVEKSGVRFGICSFGQNEYCYQHQDTVTVRRILEQLRPQCDILIVCVHGGAEGTGAAHLPRTTEYFIGENRGNMREFAHFCIDHGADLISGHGPHVPRAVELYRGRFIAYSLGNFLTRGFGLVGMLGDAPLIEVSLRSDGRFVCGRIHSFRQVKGEGPVLDANKGALRDIRMLTDADIDSPLLEIADDGTMTIKGQLGSVKGLPKGPAIPVIVE